MKNLIHIPSSNVFEEKSDAFFKSRLAERLNKKFQPKPFEETYKPVYWISLALSYFCNLFSILTASTFVFTYLLSILASLPYPSFWAVAFTSTVLVIVEALQRTLAPHLFQSILQYGFKTTTGILITIILSLSGLSVYFSFNGGFDVVSQFSKKPIIVNPILQDVAEIKTEYKELIAEAGADALAYKTAKLWNGRLSDDNAKVYNDLLKRKAELQNQMLNKVEQAEAYNHSQQAQAEANYQTTLATFENTIQSKGGGLAKFTIIAQLLFFLSIFFTEYFDYKTASQYAQAEQVIKPGNNIGLIPNDTGFQAETSELESPPIARSKIGFKQPESQLKQGKQSVSTSVAYGDKYTIDHNGKRYSMKEVNNFINVYKRRVLEANEKHKVDTAERRQKTLDYWKSKRDQLNLKLK